MKGANKACIQIRKTLSETNDESFRPFNNLDVLLITFEGVLGAFLPILPSKYDDKEDTLVLRPKIKEALSQLVINFKVVIITADQSSIHLRAMIKALNKEKVPFDAFYRTIKVANDNFFTFQTILKDLDSTTLQIMFLTSINLQLSGILSEKKHQMIKDA